MSPPDDQRCGCTARTGASHFCSPNGSQVNGDIGPIWPRAVHGHELDGRPSKEAQSPAGSPGGRAPCKGEHLLRGQDVEEFGVQCWREGAQACGWDTLPRTGCPVSYPENLLLVPTNHGSALKAHPDVPGPEWSPDWSGALAVGPQPGPLGEKLS